MGSMFTFNSTIWASTTGWAWQMGSCSLLFALQNVVLGAIPFYSTLEEFKKLVCLHLPYISSTS